MAITLQQLTDARDRLILARLNGHRRVRDANGEEIEFKSDQELKAALQGVNRLIQDIERTVPSTVRFQTSKGL